MKKYVAMLAAALAALLGLAVLAPSAQAYPFPILNFDFGITGNIVVSGTHFPAKVTADVKCQVLTLSWAGQNSSVNNSNSLSTILIAPIVHKRTVIQATATCSASTLSGTAGGSIAATTKPATRTANITVIPVGGGGKLPNTGGPSEGWLFGGLAALLAGAGAMILGRRRSGAASN